MRYLALLVLAWLAAGVNGRGAPGRPNILLVIADDASWAHFGANGDPAVRTPHFDRVAREGANFRQAFCSSPSCTPSRAALLTGQDFFRLGSTADLWSPWPAGLEGYPDRLAAAGYRVGLQGKGWGPGDFRSGGRTHNPAGPAVADFRAFLRDLPAGTPFAFWHGSQDPHRPYEAGSGAKAGVDPARVRVPGHLPDLPAVRSDLADYLAEIERFDRQLGELLAALEEAGRLDDTLVIVTSDNGLPFPRAKATAYDAGTRMPLALRWPGRIAAGRAVDALVSHTDLAPTILEAAGLAVPGTMTGRSLLPLLTPSGPPPADWPDAVVVGRERHAAVRAGNLGYPIRGLRTARHLYLRNEAPGRWPAGDPPRFGDVDPADGVAGSPTKAVVVGLEKDPAGRSWFDLSFARRPAEELYDLAADPWQTNNLAAKPDHAAVRDGLRRRLARELERRGDPRAAGRGLVFEQETYVNSGPAGARGPVGEVLGVPQVDLAGDFIRQTTVDIEEGRYLGHPTTVLLEDGRTVLAVYPEGHGRGPIRLQRSRDGGRTWAPLPVPENWATSQETPSIHRVVDAAGRKRLIVWSGLYPARLSVSEDDGATWSPLRPAGDWGGIVVMGSLEPVRGEPGHYLAWFHDDGRFFRAGAVPAKPVVFRLYQVESRDGGLTWDAPRELLASSEVHLCEPGSVRSPDGRQLALLLRENSRRKNSQVIFSDDEGRTWTPPRELAAALTGDRHTARYGPDGRLFVSFRDMAPGSPTRGDWVGWVGRYEDLAAGRPGELRVRLMDNWQAFDCAYPGVERLPDGTLLATTYGHWIEGQPPFLVAVRLRLDELDARVKGR